MTWIVFKTDKRYYLYDRTPNKIVKISKEQYEILKTITKSQDLEQYEILKPLVEKGYLLESPIERIENPMSAVMANICREHVEEMILQVTQNCNLRCEYCTYSGNNSNRVHSNKVMSENTAIKAVDFLMGHSGMSTKVNIGFYGGEPLLAFPLMKKVVAYVEKQFPNKKVNYVITTNGTLLTEEVADYLVEKNFMVTLSLDGDREMHNRHRRFQNGKESFDVIEQNLKKLSVKYPRFLSRMSTNTVINPDHDYLRIKDFFCKHEIFSQMNNRGSLLSDMGMDEPILYDKEEMTIANRVEEIYSILRAINVIKNENTGGLFENYTDSLHLKYAALLAGEFKSDCAHPGGPCLAGVKKSFVDVNGNIYPCEKVNEDSSMVIGNIFKGYDFNAIYRMLNIGQLTENQCKICWAFAFCDMCVAMCIGSCGIDKKKRLSNCDRQKWSVVKILRSLMILEEQGYDFYKFRHKVK